MPLNSPGGRTRKWGAGRGFICLAALVCFFFITIIVVVSAVGLVVILRDE